MAYTFHGRWLDWWFPLLPLQPQIGPWHSRSGKMLVSGLQAPPQLSSGYLLSNKALQNTHSTRQYLAICPLSPTIILIHCIRVLDKQRLWRVCVWLLPYPGLLSPHIQLANLWIIKDSLKSTFFNTYYKILNRWYVIIHTLSGTKWLRPSP